MSRNTLLVYNKEKFEEFYNEYSQKYKIISMSSLLNISMQFEEDYLSDEKALVDITSMVKFAVTRADVLMFYETIINYLYNEREYDIVVEHDYSDIVLKLFPQCFSNKEYLTNIEDVESKDISDTKNQVQVIKNIIVYNKDNINKVTNIMEDEDKIVISATKIMKQDYIFYYLLEKQMLDSRKKYVVDITSMIRLLRIRNDYVVCFEVIIAELSKLDNVEFIIDNEFKETCRDVFRHNFTKYIDFMQEEDVTKEHKPKSVVDIERDELDNFLEKFDNELFGHSDFKEDFKRQIKAFNILNKMGVKKVFSMFLCGESGIGKTEVARILHRNLYPNSKEIKINFGNYSGDGSLWSLIGSPKGYYGSERGGELTNKILHSNSKVILIDEFEKGNESIFSFFYELLEDGKYTDLDENEIDLNGYIIVFTSNLTEKDYKNKIPAPLFSRFNMRYEFMKLTDKDKQDFIKFKVEQLIDKYNKTFDNTFDNSKRDILLELDLDKLNNLRDINNELTNRFVELVSS